MEKRPIRVTIAHEASASCVPLVQEHTEFDFVISPYILKFPGYASAYLRDPKRVIMLDNGLFELLYPLDATTVLGIADRLQATTVIPPDVLWNFEQTKKEFGTFQEKAGGRYKLAPVVVGQTLKEMAECYAWYVAQGVDTICWSFLTNREEAMRLVKDWCPSIKTHFLGFSTCSELRSVLEILRADCSIDTGKPVAAAYNNLLLDDIGRGAYKRPDIASSIPVSNLVEINMKIFRGWVEETARGIEVETGWED